MYLLELVVKLFKKNEKQKSDFDPFVIEENDVKCEHIFLPVDSSGEVLACSKCGLVVNKKDLKDINIFKR